MSKFLKVIVNLFLILAIAIAAAILVPPLAGISTVVVDSTSMDTNLPMGSVTYAKDINVSQLVSGDKVLNENDSKTYEYEIQDGDVTSGAYNVKDARNSAAEATTITLRNSVPKVVFTVPLIGYVVMAMQSLEGIIIIGLVVLFVIILFILSELWKKTDDDDDEDDEDDEEEDDEEAMEQVPAASVPNAQQLIDTPVVPEPIQIDLPEEEMQPKMEMTENEVEIPTEMDAELPEETKKMDADELIMESQAELAAMVAMAQKGEELPKEDHKETTEEVKEETAEETKEEIEEAAEETMESAPAETEVTEVTEEEPEEDPDSFIPIPRASLDELMEKAKEDGENPNVVKDDQTGVTILDYSDIL